MLQIQSGHVHHQALLADNDFCHSRSVKVCHPEPIRCAQGKLREGSGSMGNEMLPLRCAQDDNTLPILVVNIHNRRWAR